MKIPFVDLGAQYASIREEVNAAVSTTLERGDFIMGEAVARFERDFARYCGVKHALGVSSGTARSDLRFTHAESDQVMRSSPRRIPTSPHLRRFSTWVQCRCWWTCPPSPITSMSTLLPRS